MSVRSYSLRLETGTDRIANLTKLVRETLKESGLKAGILTVFAKHTTASVLIVEDEPGIRSDTLALWERLIPKDPNLAHNRRNAGETNGHSHLRGQLQGHSITIPFNDGEVSLGRWQEIVLIDFDTHPRPRDLLIQIVGE